MAVVGLGRVGTDSAVEWVLVVAVVDLVLVWLLDDVRSGSTRMS